MLQRTPLSEDLHPLIHDLIRDEGPHIISPQLIDKIISVADIVQINNGQPLIESGSVNPDFFILLEGILRRWYWNDDREITEAFALPGTHILDYNSYLRKKGCFYTIEACCPSVLLHLTRHQYDQLLKESHEFEHWRLMMAYNTLWVNDYKKTVFQGDAKSRYLALLDKRPEILKNVPLKIIASYSGISPNYLSNVRNEIRKDELG